MDAKNYSRPAMYVIHSMLRHTAFNEIELILFLEKLYPNGKMKEKKCPRALNCILSGTDKDTLISDSPRSGRLLHIRSPRRCTHQREVARAEMSNNLY
jgi:hypothetical protein